MVAHAALGRPAGEVVLDAVAGERRMRPSSSSTGKLTVSSRLGTRQYGAELRLEAQQARHVVELGERGTQGRALLPWCFPEDAIVHLLVRARKQRTTPREAPRT